MSVSVNVLCYKSKKLSNGQHPLMVCVCKKGKRTYFSTGISIDPKYWDAEKAKPKKNCPNRQYIEKIILEKKKEVTDKVIELTAEQKKFVVYYKILNVKLKLN